MLRNSLQLPTSRSSPCLLDSSSAGRLSIDFSPFSTLYPKLLAGYCNFCKNIPVLDNCDFRSDIWAIAYCEGPNSVPPANPSPHWLVAPPGHYYADPFLVEHHGEPWVFFEDYNLTTEIGEISASPLRTFDPQSALKLPWHLSYPYLLESDGELFCIPEQHQANKVSLYRSVSFPHRWVEEAVLLENFAGVDPTVVWDGELWWMWVGEQNREAKHNTFLFYSSRLTGPWKEHRLSPAISRTNLARPAGRPWRENDRWLRPVQNRERTYGGAMALFQVETLTAEDYREREVDRWHPNPNWPFPDGLHHICHLNESTVWDAKRLPSKK